MRHRCLSDSLNKKSPRQVLVFENHLTKEMSDYVEDCMLQLPWYFQTATSDFSELGGFQSNIPNVIETPYFVNMLGCHNHGTSAQDIKPFIPIIKKLEENTGRSFLPRTQRVKANLYPRREGYPDNCYQIPHVDMWDHEKHMADAGEIFLYYVNDSDGDTFLFNEKLETYRATHTLTVDRTFTPKKGRALLFDSSYLHSSSPPKSHDTRIVLKIGRAHV